MPQDYRAYAQTPAGKAARERAHARYVQKRREQQPLFAQVRQVFVTTLAREIAHRSK
jgi:hypothetical protein